MKTLFNSLTAQYPCRHSADQKQAFIDFVKNYCINIQISCTVISGNIVIGDYDNSATVISAHYDTPLEYKKPLTCAVTPNFLQALKYDFESFKSYLSSSGKPNKNNFNDNTSGVCCALKISQQMPEKTCVILFDDEEKNMRGSKFFYKHTKKSMDDKLLINLDCIGRGEYFGIVFYNKNNKYFAEELTACFNAHSFSIMPVNNFATDASVFEKSISVAAFNYSDNVYKFDEIHCLSDNYINIENLETVKTAIIKYIKRSIK